MVGRATWGKQGSGVASKLKGSLWGAALCALPPRVGWGVSLCRFVTSPEPEAVHATSEGL